MVPTSTWHGCFCGKGQSLSKACRLGLALIAISLFYLSRTATAQGCPQVLGYQFYVQREVANAYKNWTAPSPFTVTSLSATCNATARCTAFNTRGMLMTAPMRPAFSYLDNTKAGPCDGVYISNRTITGLLLPPNTVEDLRQEAKIIDMVAASTAAMRVAAQLKTAKVPITAATIKTPTSQVTAAFAAVQTPLAQVSNVTGNYTYAAVATAILYPTWDSRSANGTNNNLISPVKDQGSCGSCVSFAATAGAEAAVATALKSASNSNDFSEQWLFFCNGLYNPTCDTGWTADEAADVLAKFSIPQETNYPYKGTKTCVLNAKPESRPAGRFQYISITNLDTAKDHIRLYGAVLTYFAVYNDFYNWRKGSAPYVWDGKSALSGYHQVLCIGYNDTGHYWIAKNSWGTSWGDNGFFLMSYTNRAGFMSASGDNVVGLTFTPTQPPALSPSPPPPTLSPPPAKSSPPPLRPPPPAKSPPPGVARPRPPSPRPPSPFPPSPRPPPPLPPPRPPPPPPPSPPAPVCGDRLCNGDETCLSCPGDCGRCARCGDGICSGGETCRSCPADCGILQPGGNRTCCGDTVCSPGDGETCTSCPRDCGTCSGCNYNGICESVRYGELCYDTQRRTGCPDCGTCGSQRCGDGICTWSATGYTETCTGCSLDCGKCTDALWCGDGLCSPTRNETTTTCSRDCAKPRSFPPPPPPRPPPPEEPSSPDYAPPEHAPPPDYTNAPPPSYYDYSYDEDDYYAR